MKSLLVCKSSRLLLVFFFSSRRRHTRYWRDWSSDVCSSDLLEDGGVAEPEEVQGAGVGVGGAGLRADRQRLPGGDDEQVAAFDPPGGLAHGQIGRASCRERV